jgi:hypothetical protein
MRFRIFTVVRNIILVCLALYGSACNSCSCQAPSFLSPPIDPHLTTTMSIVSDMLAPSNLARSGFAVIFPNGRPSEYVSYFFSEMGKSEWPVSQEESEMLDINRDVDFSTGVQILPKDVSLVPFKPDLDLKMQVVMKADDDAKTVVLEAYADPNAAPVLTKALTIPKVTADPKMKTIVEDNLSLGMGYQYVPPKLPVDDEDYVPPEE